MKIGRYAAYWGLSSVACLIIQPGTGRRAPNRRHVSHRRRRGDRLRHDRPGNHRVGGLAAAEPVQLASMHPKIIHRSTQGQQLPFGRVAGRVAEKADVERVAGRFDFLGNKGAEGRDRREFGRGADERIDRVAEGVFEVSLDPLFDPGDVRGGRLEDHVAAGNVGRNVGELRGREEVAEMVHLDSAVAEVDAAEEGDVAVRRVGSCHAASGGERFKASGRYPPQRQVLVLAWALRGLCAAARTFTSRWSLFPSRSFSISRSYCTCRFNQSCSDVPKHRPAATPCPR